MIIKIKAIKNNEDRVKINLIGEEQSLDNSDREGIKINHKSIKGSVQSQKREDRVEEIQRNSVIKIPDSSADKKDSSSYSAEIDIVDSKDANNNTIVKTDTKKISVKDTCAESSIKVRTIQENSILDIRNRNISEEKRRKISQEKIVVMKGNTIKTTISEIDREKILIDNTSVLGKDSFIAREQKSESRKKKIQSEYKVKSRQEKMCSKEEVNGALQRREVALRREKELRE